MIKIADPRKHDGWCNTCDRQEVFAEVQIGSDQMTTVHCLCFTCFTDLKIKIRKWDRQHGPRGK